MPSVPKGGWYAVAVGRQPGIYTSWYECSQQVKSFSNAKYKKFPTQGQAEEYIRTICDQTSRGSLDSVKINTRNSTETKRPVPVTGLVDRDAKKLKVEQSKTVYGVAKGRRPGVYYSWSDCQTQIQGFSNPVFRKFSTVAEAKEFCVKYADQKKQQNNAVSDNLTNALDTSLSDDTMGEEDGGFSPIMPGDELEFSFSSEKELDNEEFEESNNVVLREITSLINKSQSQSVGHDQDMGARPIVYTDGSCLNQGGGTRRAGVGVYWGENDSKNCSERLWGAQTNQRAELWAAVKALQTGLSAGYRKLEVRTDSKYAIKGVTEWMKRWKENDYKTANGQPVKNKELFCCLDSLTNMVDVRWVHVKAHNGEPGNEAADNLAKEGAKLPLHPSP